MKKALMILAVAAMIAPSAAMADLIVEVAEDGGAFTTVASAVGSPIGGTGAFANTHNTANYFINFISGTELQGLQSFLLSSNTLITNTSGVAGHVLNIRITGTGFTAPVTPPDLIVLSHIGGTVATVAAGGNTLAFQSFVNGIPVGAQTPSITSVGSYNDDKSLLVGAGVTAPYSIVQTLDLVLNGAGDVVNYSSSTTVAIPSPTSAVLGLIGMVVAFSRKRFVA